MSGIGSISLTTTSPDRPQAAGAKDAARQFEALLIGFMLKSAHESGSSSWLDSGEDSAGSAAVGYAEEQLAQALASKGGLGLAKMITSGLEDQARAYAKPAASPPDATTAETGADSKP